MAGNLMIIDTDDPKTDDKAKSQCSSRSYTDDLKVLDTGTAGAYGGASLQRSGRGQADDFSELATERAGGFDGAASVRSVKDTGGSSTRGGLPEFTFNKEEAGLVIHFFADELLRIADDLDGQTTREPGVGQPSKVTIKCLQEKNVAAVKKSYNKIKEDIQQFPSEIVSVADKASLAYKSKWDGDSKYMLYYRGDSVDVAGPNYKDVKEGAHKLKVDLGIIKTTKRGDRGSFGRSQSIPTNNSGSYPSSNSGHRPESNKDAANSFNRSRDNANPDPKDFYVRETLGEILEFKVYKASILKLNVDVIVNAANDTMVHGGGVARIISDAAGYELDKESRDYISRNRKLGVTKNFVTTAGKLKQYRGVIHAVGPQWYMYRDNRVACLDDLYDTVRNMLETCEEKGYRSVAMPAISAGIFGVPKSLCADMYVKAVADYSKRYESCPTEFHVVDIDTEILRLVKDSYQRWRQDETSIDQRKTVPEYLRKNPDPYYGGGGGGHGRGYRGNRNFGSDNDRRDNDHRDTDRGDSDRNRDGGFGSGRGGKEPRPDYDVAGSGSHPKSYSGAVQGGKRGGGGSGRGWEDKDTTSGSISPSCIVDNEANQKIGQSNIIADCFKLDKHTKVLIYTGSIDKVRDLDAVVCAVDEFLHPSGRIAKSLEDVGGYSYNDDIGQMRKDNGFGGQWGKDTKKPAGYVAISGAGKLKVRKVIHVVMPRANSERDIPVFKGAMSNVLEKAERKLFTSIALPLIGTGGFQDKPWLLEKFCDAFVETVCTFCSNTSHPELKNIHLINKAQPVCTTLNGAFAKAVGKRPIGPMEGRPLPAPPGAENTESLMDFEEEEDDTYEQIPADKSSLRGSMGRAGASTRSAGATGAGNAWGGASSVSASSFSSSRDGRGGGGSGKPYNASKYGVQASGDDDDGRGGGGGRNSDDDKLEDTNSGSRKEEQKRKGNLNILDS